MEGKKFTSVFAQFFISDTYCGLSAYIFVIKYETKEKKKKN